MKEPEIPWAIQQRMHEIKMPYAFAEQQPHWDLFLHSRYILLKHTDSEGNVIIDLFAPPESEPYGQPDQS